MTDKERELIHRIATILFKERVRGACRIAEKELAPALADQGFDNYYLEGWFDARVKEAIQEYFDEVAL